MRSGSAIIWVMGTRERSAGTLLLACTISAALLVSPVAQAAPGDLDPSFGGGGKVVTDFGGDVGGEILSEVIDSRGRIVVAGFSGTPTASHYVTLARYRPNGSLDPSFGVGGVAVTDLVGTGFSVAMTEWDGS